MLDTHISLQQIVIGCAGLGVTTVASIIAWKLIRAAYTVATNLKTAGTFLIVSVASLFGWTGARIHESRMYDAQVGDYIVAAHKTEDPGKARKYLGNALDYIKNRGANKVFTSVIYATPDEDASEWSEYLESAYAATEPVEAIESDPRDPKVADRTEKAISKTPWRDVLARCGLVKLRRDGDAQPFYPVAGFAPSGISAAPYNNIYFWSLAGILGSILGTSVWTGVAFRSKKKKKEAAVAEVAKVS